MKNKFSGSPVGFSMKNRKINFSWGKYLLKVFGIVKGWNKLSKPQCEGYWGPCNERGIKRECRTRYADDSLNLYPILCDSCYHGYTDYWNERWRDYYDGLL